MNRPIPLPTKIAHSNDLFEACFEGAIFTSPPRTSLKSLGAWGRAILAETFGSRPEELVPEEFRDALTCARARVQSAEGLKLAWNSLAELGLDCSTMLLDNVRLRAISPGLEFISEAAPVFYAHRDTWYGNPRCQLNAWLPLYDVDASNSFRFYLDAFRTAVVNDSEAFRLGDFEQRGGFGRTQGDALTAYPKALEIASEEGAVWDVEAQQDSLVLFSAAHLHQTLPNRGVQVRFSLDFRFCRRADLETRRGAPDLDNSSQGSVITGYHVFPSLN